MVKHPYSDDLMIFDERGNRYILTEKALEREGIFLRARLSRSALIDAPSVINGFVKTISTHTYNYLHQYAHNIAQQDMCIALTPAMRDVIYRAMIEQAKYVIMNGDMSLSPDPAEARRFYSPIAAEILINSGITFIGG